LGANEHPDDHAGVGSAAGAHVQHGVARREHLGGVGDARQLHGAVDEVGPRAARGDLGSADHAVELVADTPAQRVEQGIGDLAVEAGGAHHPHPGGPQRGQRLGHAGQRRGRALGVRRLQAGAAGGEQREHQRRRQRTGRCRAGRSRA